MDNNNPKNGFAYTYSAKEQEELKRIRDKYTAPTEAEDKMKRLRRLDASVTNTAQAVSLILGVIGALILGFGMSLCMTELGESLGMHRATAIAVGIVAGVSGSILGILAYPVYNIIVKYKRKKLAPEIIRLTDELMK
ncbi:MAG: MotA/TolQ/ExbB proton channel family protein [Clostridia bacterium]|nr:MotA/TolQ/ExbB proton channel family protein [Clostridia bacterium]